MPQTVAILGAGPSGIAAARWLTHCGFDCTLFEQSGAIGGQWNGNGAHSGVWPSMHTNTSRVMTAFSDLDYPSGTPVYPSNRQVRDYLDEYRRRFAPHAHVQLDSTVTSIRRNGERWAVRTAADQHDFDKVVVAAGRYGQPYVAPVPGVESFSGELGVRHSSRFRGAAPFRAKRVLVAGNGISALEIACELAMQGADFVATTQRKPRYIVPKLVAGVPVDHQAFSRFAALGSTVFPPEVQAQQFKQFLLRANGHPAQVGAPAPLDDGSAPSITLNQHYLPLVAEGRIAGFPWVASISGRRATFQNGDSAEFDAIIFATGFHLDLPYLDDEARKVLGVAENALTLYEYTFHPELPGVAFIGMFHQLGPYFSTLELQARWVAYAWSGAASLASDQEMHAHLITDHHAPVMMNVMALRFARHAGVDPALAHFPELRRALFFGPLSAVSFRLSGPDALADAAERTLRAASAFGFLADNNFSAEEQQRIAMLNQAAGREVIPQAVASAAAN